MLSAHDSPAIILLADDNEDLRETLQYMLRSHGYRVLCAPDGDSALRELAANSVDVVMLDVHMPARSGFSVCREIKSRPEMRLVPVVLIVGAGDDRARVEGFAQGADEFLSWPVRKQELLVRIRAMVALKRCSEELEIARSSFASVAMEI